MIVLNSIEYDPIARTAIDEYVAGSQLMQTIRRVTRYRTIDGGVTPVNFGATAGDSNISFQLVQPGAAIVDQLRYLADNYAELRISNYFGTYRGVIKQIDYEGDNLSVILWLFRADFG